MAATKTRKPAAKKTTAKKTTAKKVTAPKVQTTGKGRTTPALVNRHRWSPEENAKLIERVEKAKSKAARDGVFEAVAKKIGNGITPASVRAQYYAAKRRAGQPIGKATSQGAPKVKAAGKARADVTTLGDAPTYSDNPVQRVQAMVKRRGALAQAIKQAQAELDQIDSVLGAIV